MFYLDRDKLQGKTALSAGAQDAGAWQALFASRAAGARHPALRRYYQAGVVAPETPIGQAPLVALDFETTGLDPHRHGIVSIGLVPMDSRRIYCAQGREWLVKPRKLLTADSVTLHGITHSQIEDAPDLLLILDDLLAQLQGRIVVAHHGAIERDFLSAALLARIGEEIVLPLIDTMQLEARLQQQSLGWWDRLRGRKPASIRLAQSRARYRLPHYRPHHALTDALACAELLQAQITHHFSPDTPVARLWHP